MGFKITISAPKTRKLRRAFRPAIRRALMEFAQKMIKDNTERIPKRIDLTGFPQKPNSIPWAEMKLRTRGHDTPLRLDDILMDPTQWRIDGQPPGSLATAATDIVKVETSRKRSIIKHLFRLGYQVPIGVLPIGSSGKIIDFFGERVSELLREE